MDLDFIQGVDQGQYESSRALRLLDSFPSLEEDDEFNLKLIEWLNQWEATKNMSDRIVSLGLEIT